MIKLIRKTRNKISCHVSNFIDLDSFRPIESLPFSLTRGIFLAVGPTKNGTQSGESFIQLDSSRPLLIGLWFMPISSRYYKSSVPFIWFTGTLNSLWGPQSCFVLRRGWALENTWSPYSDASKGFFPNALNPAFIWVVQLDHPALGLIVFPSYRLCHLHRLRAVPLHGSLTVAPPTRKGINMETSLPFGSENWWRKSAFKFPETARLYNQRE